MLRQEHVNTLRQTHRAMTTVMPLVTAALTVTGALIATMEQGKEQGRRQARQEHFAEGAASDSVRAQTGYADEARSSGEGSVTIGSYLGTLVSHVLLTLLGIAFVLTLAMIAMRVGPVGVAIELTALVLLALYLTEKVARHNRRRARAVRQRQASQARPQAPTSQPTAGSANIGQAA
ncbi:MAG TPA: hypothetical protein VKQ36_05040 [Ktedonobacterales bacterium]|nr:hypothetical protein [Ktedonobacterales bacterium]